MACVAVLSGFPILRAQEFSQLLAVLPRSDLSVFCLPLGQQALWSSLWSFCGGLRPELSPSGHEMKEQYWPVLRLCPADQRAGHTLGGCEGVAGCGCSGRKASQGPVGTARPLPPPTSKVTPHAAGLASRKLVTLRLWVGTRPALHPPHHPDLICCPVIWDVSHGKNTGQTHLGRRKRPLLLPPGRAMCGGPRGGSAQQPDKQDQLPGTHEVPDARERPQTARVPAEGLDPAPRWHLAKSGALLQETVRMEGRGMEEGDEVGAGWWWGEGS